MKKIQTPLALLCCLMATQSFSKNCHTYANQLLVDSLAKERILNLARKIQDPRFDPDKTRVPEFEMEVPGLIFRARESIQKRKLGFLGNKRRHLKILEDFQKEAQDRIQNRSLNYSWWLRFNLRVSVLLTPPLSQSKTVDGADDLFIIKLIKTKAWMNDEDFKNLFQQTLPADSLIVRVLKETPNKIVLIPLDQEKISMRLFNELFGTEIYLLGRSYDP